MTIAVNSKVKYFLDIFKLYNFGLPERNSKLDYHPSQCFVILLTCTICMIKFEPSQQAITRARFLGFTLKI